MDNTKKSRLKRKNPDMESSGNYCMTKQKTLQKNSVVYHLKDKDFGKAMDSMKLIQVRFAHEEYSQDGYDYCGNSSWTEYEDIAMFDNIDDAWNLVQSRVEKYHTDLKNYSFSIIEINPDPENVNETIHESCSLDKYHREVERQKQIKIDQATLGFKCSECNKILKMHNAIEADKNYHAREKHIKDSSWSHVNWIRIMKKDLGGDV